MMINPYTINQNVRRCLLLIGGGLLSVCARSQQPAAPIAPHYTPLPPAVNAPLKPQKGENFILLFAPQNKSPYITLQPLTNGKPDANLKLYYTVPGKGQQNLLLNFNNPQNAPYVTPAPNLDSAPRHLLFTPQDAAQTKTVVPILTPEILARVKTLPVQPVSAPAPQKTTAK